MALPDTRHRVRYLFIAVMIGHLLLISTQVSARPGVSLLQSALASAFAEIQRAAWAVGGAVHGTWNRYLALVDVRAENQRLNEEVGRLRVQLQQERAVSQTADRLRDLLNLRSRVAWQTTGAEIIGGSTSPDFRSVVIDRGTAAGLRGDMPVITPVGLVGRVVWPSPHAATVQLIADKSAAAAVIVGASRVQAIALGHGDGTLRLDYLPPSAIVARGDQVVTAGIDGLFPKGIVVGYVEQAGREVVVRPAVDFATLELVLVIIGPAPESALVGPPAGAQVRQ